MNVNGSGSGSGGGEKKRPISSREIAFLQFLWWSLLGAFDRLRLSLPLIEIIQRL